MRASIILDVNFFNNSNHGLSQNHSILRRLANSIHNNVDFDNKRFAQAKRIGTIDSFYSHHNGLNKRIQIDQNSLEHISLFQA